MAVVIETTLGDFTVDLYIKDRPHTCKNFLKLCKMKYYNFCLFHSVQHNFIAQTGDPTGTGKNGESVFGKIYGEDKKFFEAEMMPKIKHARSGLLSMVNCGNNMLGSQFFLTLGCELQSLDNEHCIFGEVSEGHEILLKLNDVICDTQHRPYQDIRITHTVILEDPFDDPPGLLVPDCSPEPSNETLSNTRIAPDEELDETEGRSAKELEEMAREREAKAQATILEIVGDLPDAEIAPPENVLFVCKLNPVTTDDDLEIIFSRFGKVKGCEVIRDKVTGDSLQYAFVEFEEQKSCEDAFFKMDNVLIDDRRIHVDFSQSVSKLRWKGKGRGVEHFDGQVNAYVSSKRNSNKVQDDKQSKGGHSKKESFQKVGTHQDLPRSGKARESSSQKIFKQDDEHSIDRKDYLLKSDDFRRDHGAMNDKHKDKNKNNLSDERSVACQEYLSSGSRYKNKHGSIRSNKNPHDASYKDHPLAGRRLKDEDNSRVSSHKSTDAALGVTRSSGMRYESRSANRHRDENKRGNGRHREDSSTRYRDENKMGSKSKSDRDGSYKEEISSGNQHRDEKKQSSKSRNERDGSYQEELSSANWYRDENKECSKSRNERDGSYHNELSSGHQYREEKKEGGKSRNERDSSYHDELSSGHQYREEKKGGGKSRNARDGSCHDELNSRHQYREETKRGSKSSNERDSSYQEELSSGRQYREETKRGSKSSNERDSSYQEELSSGRQYRDENKRGSKSRNKRDGSYQEESGSRNMYADNKNASGDENKSERHGNYQEVSLTSNKSKERNMKSMPSTRDKSGSHNRELEDDGDRGRTADHRTSRNERDDKYRKYSGSVDPLRDERREINTSRDEKDMAYKEDAGLVDRHKWDNISDMSYTHEGENPQKENTFRGTKSQEGQTNERLNSEKRIELSNNLKIGQREAGRENLVKNEERVHQTDTKTEKKVQKHALVQSDRKKSDLLIETLGTSSKNTDGRSVKSTKTKKRRSPSSSSSSSSSDTESSSSSSSSSSSTDSSSSSSSDSSDKARRAKRRKFSKKASSKKQIVKSKKKNKGKKTKHATKKTKRNKSSSEETDCESSTSSSSSSEDERRKRIKRSKKV